MRNYIVPTPGRLEGPLGNGSITLTKADASAAMEYWLNNIMTREHRFRTFSITDIDFTPDKDKAVTLAIKSD